MISGDGNFAASDDKLSISFSSIVLSLLFCADAAGAFCKGTLDANDDDDDEEEDSDDAASSDLDVHPDGPDRVSVDVS